MLDEYYVEDFEEASVSPYLTLDEVYRDIEKVLLDVDEKFCVGVDTALVLLRGCKWSQERLEEKLLDRVDYFREKCGLLRLSLKQG